VHKDDVFVSRANTRELVGLASVAEATPSERVIYPDLLIKLTVKADTVLPRYLAYALRTSESRKQIKERSSGQAKAWSRSRASDSKRSGSQCRHSMCSRSWLRI
jgi:hypothetical protein